MRETFSCAKTPNFSTLSQIFFRLKQFLVHLLNQSRFIYYKLIMSTFSSKSEQLLREVGSSLITTASLWLSGEGHRSQFYTAQMLTASAQNMQDQPTALRFTWLRYTRHQHSMCKTSCGHFASLVVSKKVAANCWDFRSWLQKKYLLLGEIFIFSPDFET